MKLSIREKKVLYDFACPNHHNTVTRLKWLTALTVDPQAKHRMLELARKMETEMAESWYTGFYHQLRAEMDEYYRAKRRLRLVKENTDYTSRALNREFEDKLAVTVIRRCISKLFLPAPITTALALLRSVKYIREGLSALWHGKLSVAVLDATAVTVSMARAILPPQAL